MVAQSFEIDDLGNVTAIVKISLSEIINTNYREDYREGFLDLLDEKISKISGRNILLESQESTIIGHDGNSLFIKVTGHQITFVDDEFASAQAAERAENGM